MVSAKVKGAFRKKRRVQKILRVNPGIIKGSPVSLARVCGQPNCRCRKGKKHVSLYLSRSVKGRTTMTYIPHRYEEAVQEGVAEYKRMLKVLDELSEVNLQAIRQRRGI
jgi:hypothetical protein